MSIIHHSAVIKNFYFLSNSLSFITLASRESHGQACCAGDVQAESRKMCCASKELPVSNKHSPIGVIT